MFKPILGLTAALLATAFAGTAQANVSLVDPATDGAYVNLPSTYVGAGVYGAELRIGGTTTWEIGVGTATSQAGFFNQNNFAWGATPAAFTATWNASSLTVTIGNTVTSYNAPLLGDTLRFGAKRDGTVTVLNVDGNAFNQSVSGSPPGGAVNYLHFFSDDNWGGDGVTFSGTVMLGGASGGGSASEVFFQNGDFTAVPEPATWAMMIGGFGIAGAAMRRRGSAKTVTA